ncbi:hypothetical protein BU23DRAFT_569395 [Bimuria novae-zelandiae CBS 107.79]|uniref:Uncharacterized protein n=1 Tax=Bimuria novae-zelandiae CBS 107.79 TaxID=1447943 RepID=A0A6A5V4M9_9PLEO|nr:hypothetical protein BU23DRAFT_569395 [Bimuria novae-zelandiae CBS 107.79]
MSNANAPTTPVPPPPPAPPGSPALGEGDKNIDQRHNLWRISCKQDSVQEFGSDVNITASTASPGYTTNPDRAKFCLKNKSIFKVEGENAEPEVIVERVKYNASSLKHGWKIEESGSGFVPGDTKYLKKGTTVNVKKFYEDLAKKYPNDYSDAWEL